MEGRSKLAKGLWAAGGAACFGLGAVGSVLPILPTTPFILLAAFCSAHSSDRLNGWFKGTRLYAKVLQGLVTKRRMTPRAKLSVIVPVTVLMGIGFALMGRVSAGRIALAVVWAAHVVYFGFVVKTDRGGGEREGSEPAVGKAPGDEGACEAGEPDTGPVPSPGTGAVPSPARRSKNPMFKTELLALMGDARRYVWLQVAWKLLALASQVVIVLCAASLVQLAVDEELSAWPAAMAALMVAACIAVRVAADRGESRTAYLASVDVKRVLRGKVYGKLLRLGAAYRESVATSKVVQLAVEGVEQLETYFSLFLSQFVYAFAAPVVLFLVIGPCVSWKVAAVLLVFVPLIPVSIAMVQTVAKRLLSKYWGSYAQLGDTFLENLQGLATLKVYSADARAAEQMDRDSESFRVATMNVLKMQLNSTSVMDVVAFGGAAAGMVAALDELASGAIGFGGALAVLLLAAEFFLPMRRLGSYFHVGMNGMAASDQVFDLLDLPEPAARGTVRLDARQVEFELAGVTFSYDGERNALQGASMSVKAGQMVALVGASGCGKSTVAALLMGRNRGYEGRVLVNGVPLADVSEESLMRHVTLVSRASHVFKGTVRDNLALARPAADDGQLMAVLRKVNLADFVLSRGGLDMPVEEGGGNLSGGQRQRLVLARALLHDTPAYIFDEATSSIDAESEAVIMGVVRELARERTVVLISHRLANVVGCDRIYHLRDGEVTESGTHGELMAAGGEYARLFGKQAELESFSATAGGAKRREVALSAGGTVAGGEGPSPVARDDESGPVRNDGNGAARNGATRSGAACHPGRSGGPSSRPARLSGLGVMRRLVALVRRMAPVMCLAVLLGAVGFACAIFLTVAAGYGAVGAAWSAGALGRQPAGDLALLAASSLPVLAAVLVLMAVARGLLHYGEQYCNHYIAFRMLAIVRHEVFAKLRTLAPAKLDGRDKGDLISLITGDVELLEVFYAHTVSPMAIAVLVSAVMVAFQFAQHWVAGLIACVAYLAAGVALPLWNGRRAGDVGMRQREEVAQLNSYVLDSLYGLDETIQYAAGAARAQGIDERSRAISATAGELNRVQRDQVAATDVVVQVFSWGMLFALLGLWSQGAVGLQQAVIATLAMAGSFGPVIALSNLSVTLSGTLASGRRVLGILDEAPETPDVAGRDACAFGDVALQDVGFSYGGAPVLSGLSLRVPVGTCLGICGPSGSGKSTVCKLIMRFWDADQGSVRIGERDVRDVNTADLRAMESHMTQETWLFHSSIYENIALGRPGATRDQAMQAARAASLGGFIDSLPQGIDTPVGELGDTLSDGERQRIGLARAFLHDAPLMLLDEPTSNLDSLNEAVILKSLADMGGGRAVVLVSHRESTMSLADSVVRLQPRAAS